jgi:hypothetical protein
VVQGLSVQARDGATRADLETVRDGRLGHARVRGPLNRDAPGAAGGHRAAAGSGSVDSAAGRIIGR